MIATALQTVLTQYSAATQQAFANHPLAEYLRHDAPRALVEITPNASSYRIVGLAGRGNWTTCPWIAVLDPDVTTTVRSGFYPVYLFHEELDSVYLSLNQGITLLLNERGARETRTILTSKADYYRSLLGRLPDRMTLSGPIDLGATTRSSNTAYYELGHICGVRYDAGNLPADDVLRSDYHTVLALYERLALAVDPDTDASLPEPDADVAPEPEDYTRWRNHKRLDRNPSLARKVKAVHGYTCEVCGLDMEALYGAPGKDFIESHHLVPVQELAGRVLMRDPKTDFAVLCPNCHRMIHRSGDTGALELLSSSIRREEFRRLSEA